MTGSTPHRTIHRLRAIGRTFFALGAALLLVAVLAPFASAVEVSGPESDDRAQFVEGNFTDADCTTSDSLYISPTASASDDHVSAVVSILGILEVMVNGDPATYEDVQVLNVTAEPGVVISAISVKGGDAYNLYMGNFPNMIAPIVGGSGQPAEISHYTICYDVVPDLTLEKSGPASADHDETFSYTLVVGNAGAADTGAITVTDTLPDAVTFVSATPDGCTYDEATHGVTCDLDALAPGGSHDISIEVTVDTEVCGPFTNSASATEDETEDSASDEVTTTIPASECETITVEEPNPSVDVEKLVSLDGINFLDADSAPGAEFSLQGEDATQDVWFRVVVTNDSGDGTELTLNSLTDTVQLGGGEALDLEDCTFPEGVLEDGESVTCDLGPFTAVVGTQHTNEVAVSASGGGETVQDSDPANYLGEQVAGVVIDRPDPEPAPEPDVEAEPEPEPDVETDPEPAPEVLGVTEELPRTGPEDLWLAGLALMLLGAGLLTIARGKAMDATAYVTGTWWTSHRP